MRVATRWWSRALILGAYLAVILGYEVWASQQDYPLQWLAVGPLAAYALYQLWWWRVGVKWRREEGNSRPRQGE